MAYQDDVLVVLRSMDATLKTLLALSQQRVTQARAAKPKPIASDSDLDSQYGDEKVRLNPRDWTGASLKGRPMSACPAEFLDLLAESYDYFERKNEEAGALTDKGKPKADYDRRSASRARGWAKRARAGWSAKTQAAVRGNGAKGSDEWAGDLEDGF
jgi:hypothetical protein